MYKNVASQKVAVYAWDNAAGTSKTGDAAQITAQISKDGAATAATNDVNPTELDATDAPGIYIFDMEQAETNGDLIVISPVSSTADIVLRPVIIYTQILPPSAGAVASMQSDVDAILVDTNETIPGLITAASPTLHTAASNTEVGNTTLDGGTYADTETNDDTNYYQTGPGTAVGGFGLNCVLGFELGIGRIPSTLTVDGHFDSGAQRTVQVWAYNYLTSAYVQLSNSVTDFNNSASDSLRQYALTSNMVDQSTGAALIRFTSTSVTVSDVFEIDYCIINSVASAAAGLTANAIQAAVWNRTASGHDEDTLGYNLSKTHIMGGEIVSATSATQFIIDGTVAANDCLNGMIIMLEDKTDDHYEVRRIVDSITSTNEIFVDRAFGFTPVALDDFYIMSSGYGDVNVTHTAGSAYADTDLDTVLSKLNLITAMVV